jgi:hypothetical protein
MNSVEPGLRAKLQQVLGHARVYPDAIPMKETPSGELQEASELPAVSYRLNAGIRHDTLDKGYTNFHTDSFLVEVFARDATECQDVRRLLFAAFKGPPKPNKPGWPDLWDDAGPKIRWAEAVEPSGDTEFPTTDAHDLLRFVQLILVVTYHERA